MSRMPNRRPNGAERQALWLRVIFGLALLAGALWLMQATEWVEEDDPPARPRVDRSQRWATLKALTADAGVTLTVQDQLDTLPPPGSTLWLADGRWSMFPGRVARLQAWVEAGGRLMISPDQMPDEDFLRWAGVRVIEPAPPVRIPPCRNIPAAAASKASPASTPPAASTPAPGRADDDEDPDDEDEDRPAPPPVRCADTARSGGTPPTPADIASQALRQQRPGAWQRCGWVSEGDPAHPAFANRPALHTCLLGPKRLASARGAPQWALGEPGRWLALRLPVGRGTVTVDVFGGGGLDDRWVREDDHPLLLAALADFRPGQTLWLVDDEKKARLIPWLWAHARAPLLCLLAAIGAGLWRLLPRFGPPLRAPARARRSMAEQIRGTGDFIGRLAPAALHRASLRALDEAARAHFIDWAHWGPDERTDALAAHLGLARERLRQAWQPGPQSRPAAWLSACATLEQARRRLRQQRPGRPTPGPGP